MTETQNTRPALRALRALSTMHWFTPTMVLIALMLGMFPASGEPLSWQRGDALWMAWSAHLVHWGGSHLFWDMLVVACCGWQLDRRAPGRHLLLWLLTPLLTIACVCALQPEIAAFRGSSGIASAQFCTLMLLSLKHRRRWALLGLAAFPVKTLYECIAGGSAFADLQGAVPLASSHLVGAGVAVALHLLLRWRSAPVLRADRPAAA